MRVVTTPPPDVTAARVYDATAEGAARVLVDRIWPRGLGKEAAHLDEWCRDLAPSTELRRWYGHDPQRFDEFARRYRAELQQGERAPILERLRDLATSRPVVLLTATRDVTISNAAVLADLLRAPRRRRREP